MKHKDLIALGLPQDCVLTAIEALKASGLIQKPQEARDRIAEMLLAPPVSAPCSPWFTRAPKPPLSCCDSRPASAIRSPKSSPSAWASFLAAWPTPHSSFGARARLIPCARRLTVPVGG